VLFSIDHPLVNPAPTELRAFLQHRHHALTETWTHVKPAD
jgi:hypothetical protein